MTALIDPTKSLTADQLKEFGTIITDASPVESSDVVSIERKIEDIHRPVTVTFNFLASEFVRVSRLAQDSNQSVEDYLRASVTADIKQRIGRASITGPSSIGSVEVPNQIIKGPTGSVTRA